MKTKAEHHRPRDAEQLREEIRKALIVLRLDIRRLEDAELALEGRGRVGRPRKNG